MEDEEIFTIYLVRHAEKVLNSGDSNDPNLWAEKILELSTNQEIIKKVSLEGKKLIVDEYNLNIFYKNLKNITDI